MINGSSQRWTEPRGFGPGLARRGYELSEASSSASVRSLQYANVLVTVEQVIMKPRLLAGGKSPGMPAHLPCSIAEWQLRDCSEPGTVARLEARACRRCA